MTTIAATGMWAATQGTTHDHPISDELTKKYLTEYLGITNYGDNNWGYTSTDGTTDKATQPTATTPGNVLFVQVNDYWKGSNWSATPSLYNQIKYGVKSIDKVSQSSQIGSGMLYHYDATTNRFFFAIRTSEIYDGSGASWQEVTTNKYYLKESYTRNNTTYNYPMPFRWYNEFSATTSTDGDGWDHLEVAYDSLKNGNFYPVPHSCSNSLEKNHFTTLYSKDAIGKTYTVSAMLYVPSGANATTNQKNGSFSTSNIPQVFFYINKLTGERDKNTVAGADCDYSAKLNWTTSFDLAKAKHTDFITWKSGTDGVKEESKIYRKIEGEVGFTLVKEGEDLVDVKTWTDNTLPNPGKEGYSVEYYVVTEAITYNAQGVRTGDNVGTAATNHIILHIPGSESFFELEITNKFNSKYNPSNGIFGAGTNTITNTVKPSANEFSPKLNDIKAGDKLELVRMENGKTDVAANTVIITDITKEEIHEDIPITFTVNGSLDKSELEKITSSINGYDLYGLKTNLSVAKKTTKTGTVNITFSGMQLPRTVYAKMYTSSSNNSGGSIVYNGTTVNATNNNTLTSLNNFKSVEITDKTKPFTITATGGNNSSRDFNVYFLVPNNITERVDETTTTYNYTINGKSESIKDPADLEPILKATANYTETRDFAPSEIYDVKYQMVYTSADGKTVLHSNTVASKSMATEVKAKKLYRSGTPDVVTDADKKEVYTCRVSFKPIDNDNVAHYHIWMNGTDKLMRVGHSGGENYRLVGKDENGNFNKDLGPIYIDDGYLNVLVDAELSKRANPGEMYKHENPFNNNDLFFTVEVVTTGDNSYGNIDQADNYTGNYMYELVYNSEANIYYGEGSVEGYFRAEVDWDRAFKTEDMDDDDIIKQEPAFYTVYRKLDGEDVYTPLKNFYIEDAETGYKPYLEKAGEEAFKFTPELIEELYMKQKIGFKVIDIFEKKDWTIKNAFPAMYYVKA
ncbi:MAG: hypothetical protein KBT10_10245, partial [Bacteroidales bacterium]|nr:hypothetical protein [Candidatus Sodaliphilus aphodohippi]